MNQRTPTEVTAAADIKLNGSDNSTELLQAEQLEEYNRIRKMSRFIRITDDLDIAVREIMDRMLGAPPSINKADFEYRDISDMAMRLPSAESLLKPDFFDRTALIFRLFRRTMDLYMVNSTSMDAVLAIRIPDKDLEDPRMIELIWFLLWIGAASTNIAACVKVRRENMVSSSRHTDTDKQSLGGSYQRRPEPVQARQDVRNPSPVFITDMHNKNYVPDQPSLNATHNNVCKTMHSAHQQQLGRLQNAWENSGSDAPQSQSKKGYAVKAYFRNRELSGSSKQVKRALKGETASATHQTYQPGDQVLIWCEKLVENRIGEWIGPFTVVTYDATARIVLVQEKPGSAHQRLNASQVKPFIKPAAAACQFVNSIARRLNLFPLSRKDWQFT